MTEGRRRHLGRLVAIERRALDALDAPDFSALRSTTNARESGVDLRGPDAVRAARYLTDRRDEIVAALGALTADVPGETSTLIAALEEARRTLDVLGRGVDLIETMLYPRVENPPIAMGMALSRAAAIRAQTVSVSGDDATQTHQVRGLLRFLAEVIGSIGDHAYAHVTRDGGWVEVTLSPDSTDTGEWNVDAARIEFIRFAGYLIRAQAELHEGGWQVAFVALEA